MMVRNIAGHRSPNPKVQEPEITDQGRKQRPDTIRCIAKMVNDEGRQEKTDACNKQECKPVRGYISSNT